VDCLYIISQGFSGLVARLSGYKSNRLNWLAGAKSAGWDEASPKTFKTGVFSKTVMPESVRIVKIGKTSLK